MLIHERFRDAYRKAQVEYIENDSEGEPPLEKMLFLPANITGSKLRIMLFTNNGRAIIAANEADTLIDAIKREFGDFSADVRNMAEHEPISFGTKKDGIFEIDHTELSIVISSTPNQLLRLLPEIENGLFSRFIYFRMPVEHAFVSQFENPGRIIRENLRKQSECLMQLFDALEQRADNPVYFEYTLGQRNVFSAIFNKEKRISRSKFETQMYGSINRMGITMLRISMQLTILRALAKKGHFNHTFVKDKLVCANRDFICAMHICKTLVKTSYEACDVVMGQRNKWKDNATKEKQHAKRQQCMALHLQGFSHADIAEKVLDDRKLKGTVSRWIKQVKGGDTA